MMCRGTPKEKAGLLFDFVHKTNKEYLKTVNKTYNLGLKTVTKRETIMQQPEILWSNQRLRKAMFQLVFYSEILPKQIYLNYVKNETENEKDQNQHPVLKESNSMETLQQQIDQSAKDNHKCLDGWDPEYVQRIYSEYDAVFKTFYEDKIIEKIFPSGINTLTKEEFLSKVCPESLFGAIGDLGGMFGKEEEKQDEE